MGLLDRIGLVPRTDRRPRRGGIRLEGRQTDPTGPRTSKRGIVERFGLYAALTVLALLAFPNISVYDGGGQVDVGDVWQAEDVITPFDFSIRLPEEQLRAKYDSVRRVEPPVFAVNPQALAQTLARLDSVDARLDSAYAVYGSWRRGAAAAARADTAETTAERERSPELRARARSDSARYATLRSEFTALTDSQWALLLRSAIDVDEGRQGGQSLDDRLIGEASRVSRELLARGVLDVVSDSLRAPTVLVRDLDPAVRSEDELQRNEVVAIEQAYVFAQRSLFAAFPGRPDTVAIGSVFVRSTLEPSLAYQAEATQRRRQAGIASVLPTRGQVREGYTIIRRGDEVTQQRYDQLASLREAQRERSGVSWIRTVAGRFVLVSAALLLFGLYLYLLRPAIFDDIRRMVLVSLLLGFVLLGYLVAGAVGGVAAYAVPVALVSTLLTIVFDSRVGSFGAITLAILGGLIFGYDFELTFATLVVGVLAVFSVRDVKNRSQLLATSALVLGAYVVILFGYALVRAEPFSARFINELVAVSAHSVLLLLAGAVLVGIERGFGVTTDMTLLELSDTNRPLLKELSLRAPGTFNHALQVANLAEAAADAVGANALRARVGALYHDIGKMLKPEYFIENQQPGENPHEKLKPSMSALVIAAHVKDGLELGRSNRLPKVVLDFITTHHGTSLMEFFYRKAQEQRGPDDPPVDEAEFRYPGPRPWTSEQAIVALADSVEAASRSLDKPTPRRLESLIDSIFQSRVADGQLDKCRLTFSDLTTVRETFHGLLCGIYHFRVKYPDQASGEPPGAAPVAPPTPTPEPPPTESGDGVPGDGVPGDGVPAADARPTSEERSTLG